ncbi:coiled-coil domain-containing protein 50-like isoform X7 [Myxocyprinus asiaticus]|uniref:coiled-coil domain-containing protein 50-like isoform X7 n=1 Tax=Myxocyprinus asiaticus TaxID=70543 RepID=UPI002222008D|nr:coiled-coil domain-containing protein 50-like isoform X7 [Myxocyprinus asiaticus]
MNSHAYMYVLHDDNRQSLTNGRRQIFKKVCQCFSVLEDGAVAHSLQEQEIEQFYNTNIQKNQAEQNDVRLARRLQEEEERRANLRRDLRQLEDEDCRYAQIIQEELQRCAEEARRREEEDKEIAKQLQEEEEMEMRQQRAAAGYHGDNCISPLCEGLGVWEQVLQDAELARRLQEEEDMLPNRELSRSSGSDVDFITAQVAQDEALQMLRERLNSEGLHSPVEEDYSIESHLPSPSCTALRTQHIHNIAEELDPTFKARKHESHISTNPPSGLCLAPRNPHSIFYDYLPEPTFVPPTKRQSDKAGRHKAKDKKENCKQQ